MSTLSERKFLLRPMSQGMPQDGAIIFADLIGKLDVLSTYCNYRRKVTVRFR
jgi:hypothetical protein